MNQNNCDFPEELHDAVYTEFCKLTLAAKLVVFARVTHGASFKPVNNDLLGLDRKLTTSHYQDFLANIRIAINEPEKTITVKS
jgi:hypothetical protein